MCSFHVVVLQRTIKKCTKIYNARARLLFGEVLVPDVFVVCLKLLSYFGLRLAIVHKIEQPLFCSLLTSLPCDER